MSNSVRSSLIKNIPADTEDNITEPISNMTEDFAKNETNINNGTKNLKEKGNYNFFAVSSLFLRKSLN